MTLWFVASFKDFLDVLGLVPVSHNRDFRLCRVDAYHEAPTFYEASHELSTYTVERRLFMQTCKELTLETISVRNVYGKTTERFKSHWIRIRGDGCFCCRPFLTAKSIEPSPGSPEKVDH